DLYLCQLQLIAVSQYILSIMCRCVALIFFQAEDGIRDYCVTGVQTCALPISGGGSYIAQRMLASKSEKDALGAVLFFSVAHYVLRPWPWILVGLASLIVY